MGPAAGRAAGAGFLALSWLVSCAPEAQNPAEPPGAHLVCAEPEVDFGSVWEGDLLDHEFVFEVVGDGREAVEAVRADCGCTLAQLEVEGPDGSLSPYENGSPLGTGDRLHVQVSYNTHGKRGSAPRTVTLYAAEGAVRARILADVKPWLTVTPGTRDLGLLRDSDSASCDFRVKSTVGEPFQLTHTAKAVPPEVTVRLTPLDASGEPGSAPSASWRVDVDLAAGMPRGPHVYPIELTTDQVHRHGAPITATPYVTVQVVGPASLTPASLAFGIIPAGEIVSRTTRFVLHDPTLELRAPAVHLENVRPEDFELSSYATLRVLEVPGERAFDLRVTFSDLPVIPKGNFLGRLIVETGLEEIPVLEAPVTGVVLPDAGGSGSPSSEPTQNG